MAADIPPEMWSEAYKNSTLRGRGPASADREMADQYSASFVLSVIAAGTFGPLVTAFCTELGKRLGGSTADWVERVSLRRRRGSSEKADLVISLDKVTVVEIGEHLSDEARLALLDLNIESDDLCGHRLSWNEQAEAWLPVDPNASLDARDPMPEPEFRLSHPSDRRPLNP